LTGLTVMRPVQRKKLWEEVAFRLRAMIEDGTFPEGTLLPSESDLMQMFGVGRPSIREALFALHLNGLVAITSGERARVTVPSPDTLLFHLSGVARHFLTRSGGPEHFQEARAIFEIGVARIAAQRGTLDDVARLEQALKANVAAKGDRERFGRTDVAFHYVLAVTTRNPIFTAVHDAIVDWLTSQRTAALRAPDAEEIAARGHQRIFAAVADGNPDAAAAAMSDHLAEIAALLRQANTDETVEGVK
jgi:GntR family transcriptional regulator, sialic acid-inducible nan operon repressor